MIQIFTSSTPQKETPNYNYSKLWEPLNLETVFKRMICYSSDRPDWIIDGISLMLQLQDSVT